MSTANPSENSQPPLRHMLLLQVFFLPKNPLAPLSQGLLFQIILYQSLYSQHTLRKVPIVWSSLRTHS